MTGPHVLALPFDAPPLNLNDSGVTKRAAFAKAAKIKQVRLTATVLAEQAQLPKGAGHAVVELHYRPKDRRRRDTDNLIATAKPCFDGLVDYGLVPDDVPQHMSKPEPVIHQPARGNVPRLWLQITTSDTPKELPE